MHLHRYRLFLVDMDDTLFEERDFVLSGFQAVANFMAKWAIEPEEAEAALRRRFTDVGRGQVFDHVLRFFLGEADPERVQELVRVYREHTPRIAFYAGVADKLKRLRCQGRVVIVTDGLPSMQAQKVAALGLARLADQVVYCWATNTPKPDPRALTGIVTPGDPDAVLIGDDPDRDLALAAALGIDAIRVRTGRFKNKPNTPWTPCADVEAFVALH